jgi:hypothetical protein
VTEESEQGNRSYVEIKPKKSLSLCLGFVEGVPVIGSAIAIIKSIYHGCEMIAATKRLKRAEWCLRSLGNAELTRLNNVFTAAVDCTVHWNQFVSSVISIVPLLKPILRLAQGVSYQFQRSPTTVST